MRCEHFHRLVISLGYAAQDMPRLKIIDITLYERPRANLNFTSGRGAEGSIAKRSTLIFESYSGYKPDKRIAAAWGFSLDDLVVEDSGQWERTSATWEDQTPNREFSLDEKLIGRQRDFPSAEIIQSSI
ncbi:hypothetical protein BJX63DRAFT_390073 [Aspergillus granulosus]|uniref:Uncharacterized protein n=1 Tax=Aspergillus granulosus TaxID=176169 RepID=A0ABR4HJF8_9EURO